MKEIFSEIYRHNMWGGTESVSGPGSSLHESKNLIEKLPSLFDMIGVKSILDAPCGDYNWMKHVPKANITYTGIDIVDEMIVENTRKYAGENVRFEVKNIVEDDLPVADLVICRDCLVHLPFADIKKAIANFKRSGSRYLLATHFPDWKENRDIGAGDWRPLNLLIAPFSFPDPILMIKETTTIKTMALWKFADL